MRSMIGSGYYADERSESHRRWFFDLWAKNNLTSHDRVTIVDNSSTGLIGYDQHNIIRINNNLGHVAHHLGDKDPRLLGWSMSWILPALIAYSEQIDFIYLEQDCLCFGDWRKRMADLSVGVDFVLGKNSIMECEQSLFWIRCNHIPEFVGKYMSIKEGDGQLMPETKFMRCMPSRWRTIDFPGGRDRPIELSGTFYIQQITEKDLSDLRAAGLIPPA